MAQLYDCRDAFAAALEDIATHDPRICAVVNDSVGSSKVSNFGKRFPDRIPGQEYLRWLAIGRLYLESIPNVQVSWLTQGLDVGREGLHYGANDLGSTMIEENVISPAGAHHKATELMLRDVILSEGFTPIKRRADYLRLEPMSPHEV